MKIQYSQGQRGNTKGKNKWKRTRQGQIGTVIQRKRKKRINRKIVHYADVSFIDGVSVLSMTAFVSSILHEVPIPVGQYAFKLFGEHDIH